MARTFWMIVCLAAASVLDRPLDTLRLANGREVQGHVLRVERDQYTVLVETRQQTYEASKVESVRSPVVHLNQLAAQLRSTPAGDVEANWKLSLWCQEQGLEHEARLLAWRVLAADWSDGRAHGALGHRERRGEYEVRHNGKWMDRERWEKASAEWRDALEIETSLVRLRGNVPLTQLVEAAVEWTLFYQAFYALWGDPVGYPHASEWMGVHLHGDSKSFPKVGSGQPSYFLEAENRIVLDATRVGGSELARERQGQILYSSYRNAENGRGSAPPWLSEALGVFLRAATEGGRAPDPERILHSATNWFALHARAKEPFSLNRILVASGAEFREVPGHELRMAQAYTLLDYCWNAEQQTLRPKFIEYVRGTLAGHVSPTHFQNAMGLDSHRFDGIWQAWASERADQREEAAGDRQP